MKQNLFFSIIVPAHNEESIIKKTLTCLKNLDYPQNAYEIIVVENGSNDATFVKAKAFESPNFKIYTTKEKGVSRARNFGINQCSKVLDWGIIMDADTFLKKDFLSELNAYLETHRDVDYGTTTILLDDETLTGRFWSWYTNQTDKFFKVMHRIHIVRKELFFKVRYDEELALTEDLWYSRDLSKLGRYFFMKTKNVIVSARRFKQKGYIKMFFINIYSGLMPKSIAKKKGWEVIR